MTNEVRTLLLNQPAFNTPEAYVAEEYTPPDFVPRSLPTYLQAIRTVLFGSNPDRHMMNYRGRQFMTLIHGTPLRDHVTAVDPRVTYDTGDDTELLTEDRFQPRVTQISGATATLSLFGRPDPPDGSGRLYHAYRVQTLAETIDVRLEQEPFSNPVFELSLTDGWSQPFTLPATGYQARINTDATNVAWTIETLVRPQWDLGQITANLAVAGEPVLVALFGLSPVEPYATYRALWNRTDVGTPLRLSALLLAVARRISEQGGRRAVP